ncbi:adenylate/guanylate cyclase domain-containing protein [Intrasporangium calvum]|uniref:Adenylate/guanylate cyclase n=1 Tax=Intrasporangium calvum (strain ATCC 23552 / DSM 43043 / JCM 3097 / NBRC 12989 / NCIMB 10167 / NRRL B-3866 / 7 KIP) TaxID=710696 RepID=E6SFL9_INTC7|nr:adenylate/guanylate cyclase domain-containing protein [Intrasporangium calvum]ADU47764.1 adenylate/guanylate cyclase [Intrasporangium calvum DSM 43043]AXG12882.1 adenylate/guanylate cyclase domain-containing protein [Intrasporangium calvum]
MTQAGGSEGTGPWPAEPPPASLPETAPEPEPEPLPGVDVDAKEVIERLLGQTLEMGRRDVTREAGVSLLSAQKFWRALGFPVVYTDDELFTGADVDALRAVAGIVRDGDIDETLALAMTRAVARSADRLAVWQAQLVAEAVETEKSEQRATESVAGAETRVVPSLGTAAETAQRMADLADRFEPLLVYAWRRHLSAAISRMLADADPASYGLVKMRSVGFADLVNFTSLVRKMSERDLARLVHRFERLSADVITAHGGRLIKTVGDEVLFTTVQAAPAAAIALDLVETISQDDVLPEVRCGMARGPIVSSLGDVFGTTVNRASRLTAVAQSGSVLVDAPMARELATLSGFQLTGQRRRILRGVGPVSPSMLRRAPAEGRRPT